jgi:hypothetical protein
LGVVDEEGKRVVTKSSAFVQQREDAFSSEFEKLIKDAYRDIFELHGDHAWDLDKNDLTHFFRTSDHSSEVVGERQAGTFAYLAAVAGHAREPAMPEAARRRDASATRKSRSVGKASAPRRIEELRVSDGAPRFGLTVRIEVNLPAEGDQAPTTGSFVA